MRAHLTRRARLRAAAERGGEDAAYALAFDLDSRPPRRVREALHWFRKAAAAGHVEAQDVLALRHALGEGARRDPRIAAHWWRKAAARGHAHAELNLGVMHGLGDGVRKNR